MSTENLSSQQQDRLNTFKEITQVSDDSLGISILEHNNWNVEQSVNSFLQGGSSVSFPSSSSSSSSNGYDNRNNSNDITNQSTNQSNSVVSNPIWNPLRWLFQTRPVSLNPELDTRRFIADFELKFGSQHPQFCDTSYQSAVAQAFRSSKFLLVYIHSPMHEDTSKFCRQVLCTQTFSSFVGNDMMMWVGQVWDPEAYSLSIQLRTTTFPFLALLVCQSDRVVQIAKRIQGFQDEATLTESLRNTANAQRSTITRMRAEAERRSESTRLREQQDREYRESLEEERREAQRQREQEEEAARIAEENRNKELEREATELSLQLHEKSTMEKRRAKLSPEPPQSADIATIRFQLPSSCQSAKLTRRFDKSDTVETITDYLLLHFYDSSYPVKRISLSTHYPKQELDDMTTTVEQAGLFPRGMLYVQDLDA